MKIRGLDCVKVPFPPAYVSEFIQRFRNEEQDFQSVETRIQLVFNSGVYPPVAEEPQTYSLHLINEILFDKEMCKEYRIPWCVENERFYLNRVQFENRQAPYKELVEKARSLNLTLDEAKALLAFANSSTQKEAHAAFFQGGVLNSGASFFCNVFLPGFDLVLDSTALGTRIIKRKGEQLQICNHAIKKDEVHIASKGINNGFLVDSSKEINKGSLVDSSKEINKGSLVDYSENYFIEKNGRDEFTLTVDPQNEVFLSKNIWDHILATAKQKLEKTDFNDVDLFLFIPCLADEGFLKNFLESLRRLEEGKKEAVVENITRYATACYGWNPEEKENDIAQFLIESNNFHGVQQLTKAWEDYAKYLDTKSNSWFIFRKKEDVTNKINIVQELLTILKNGKPKPSETVQEFSKIFEKNKTTLEKSRDSWFDALYKYTIFILTTLATFGLKNTALRSYFWSIKGKEMVNQTNEITQRIPKSN